MNYEFDLNEIWSAIWRQWKTASFVLFAIIFLTWLALLAWPRTFASEAKLFLRVGRESVTLDPTASIGQTMMLQKTQDEEVNAALDILNSRHIREQVVDKVGVDVILNGPASAPGAGSKLNDLLSSAIELTRQTAYRILDYSMIRDKISDRERAVQKVEDWLSIYAPSAPR